MSDRQTSSDRNTAALFGENIAGGEAIHGETNSVDLAAVAGISLDPAGKGSAGVFGKSNGAGAGVVGVGKTAGFFDGDVVVAGALSVANTDIGTLIREVRDLQNQHNQLLQQVNLGQQGTAQSLVTLAARVTALEQRG
jgi:hypothetical protein